MKLKTYSLFGLIAFASLIITVMGIRSALQDSSNIAAQPGISSSTLTRAEAALDRVEAWHAEFRDEHTELANESKEMVKLLASLAERLDKLEKERTAVAAASSAEAVAQAPEHIPADEERAEERSRARFRLLDDAIDFEELDSGWSRNAELEIADAVEAAAEQGLSLAAAECRSTLCRIRVAVDPAAPEDEAMRALLDAAPWSGERFFRFKGGQDGGGVLYLAREGARLPSLEDAAR